MSLLESQALPFLKEFHPELVIVCAGFDALMDDPLADINLVPLDYRMISEKISAEFGPVVFGMEGGYDLATLPLALKATIMAQM